MPFDPDQPRDEKGQWTDTGDVKTAASGNEVTFGYYTGDVIVKGKGIYGNIGKPVEKLLPGEVPFFDPVTEKAGIKYEAPVVTNFVDAGKALSAMANQKVLNDDHQAAVYEYTSSEYGGINSDLRRGYESMGGEHRRVIKDLDDFLSKAPKYNGESYRGIQFTSKDGFESFLSNATDDNIFEDEGFGSTSLDSKIVSNFRGESHKPYKIDIVIKGKSGVYVAPISAHSEEKEVLFPRNTKFKVNNVQVVENELDNDTFRKKARVYLEEL